VPYEPAARLIAVAAVKTVPIVGVEAIISSESRKDGRGLGSSFGDVEPSANEGLSWVLVPHAVNS